MVKSCPINFSKVDETSVRMQAGFIAVFGLSFILQTHLVWLLVLLYDFSIRIAGYKQASLFYLASRFIITLASLPTHQVDAGPKQFAAKIGLLFVITSIGLFLFGFDTLSTYVVGALTVCALLESLFGYCVGCEIYPLWYALIYGRKK